MKIFFLIVIFYCLGHRIEREWRIGVFCPWHGAHHLYDLFYRLCIIYRGHVADFIVFISADLRLTVFALHSFFELRVGFTSYHWRLRVGCVFEQILPLLIYYLVSASISLDNRLLMTIIRRLLISARVIRPWFLWVAIPASWCVQLWLLWERVLRLYDFLRFSWLNSTLVLAIDWRFFGSLFRALSLGLRFLLLDSCLLLD